MVSQVWTALLSWASEGGPEKQEVLELISTEQRKTFLFWPGGEETSATGEVQPDGDPVLQARSFQSNKNHLNIGLRRFVRFNPLLGPEMEEEVERLFHTRSPARCKLPLLTFFKTSLSGLLAVSSLLLEAGAALVLGTLQSPDPLLTSRSSTQPAG